MTQGIKKQLRHVFVCVRRGHENKRCRKYLASSPPHVFSLVISLDSTGPAPSHELFSSSLLDKSLCLSVRKQVSGKGPAPGGSYRVPILSHSLALQLWISISVTSFVKWL